MKVKQVISESFEGLSKEEMISKIKQYGFNYNLKNKSVAQIYNILLWAEKKDRLKKEKELQKDIVKQAKYNDIDSLNNYSFVESYYNYDIYINNDTKTFCILGTDLEFESIEAAQNYIDFTLLNNIDDTVDESLSSLYEESNYKKRKKKAMGWFTTFNRDPEKEIEIFNHNMTYNNDTDNQDNSEVSVDVNNGEAGASAEA